MVRRALLAVSTALLFAGALASPALAWDPEADRVADQLAYERLTPAVRAKVDAIFAAAPAVDGCPVGRLDDAAGLASCLHGQADDFMRGVRYSASPLCGAPPPSRCADGRCAGDVLASWIAALKAPSTPATTRTLALEAIAYLVPELHQPLHAADNGDRSGERVPVVLPGARKARTNLYSVWDNDLVASAVVTAETGLPYVRALADAHGEAWSRGDLGDWLRESHDVALHVAYGRLPDPPACNKPPAQPEALGPDYFAAAVPAVREQLAKAGVRLAAILNATLS